MAVREQLKWWLFPGLNLNARLRRRLLPDRLGVAAPQEERWVLDAGCGNGMLAYESYRRGNHVVGISIKEAEVARCRSLFHDHLGIPDTHLSFRVANLYEVEDLSLEVDEIICTEVMEHLADDARVCRSFWNILRPGGTLHICCPNTDHPDNQATPIDHDESGGHVRPGYTMETYHRLLDPIGFHIEEQLGLGGPVRQAFKKRITQLETSCGFAAGFVLFVFALPWLIFDHDKPKVPYSLYVRAVKPGEP